MADKCYLEVSAAITFKLELINQLAKHPDASGLRSNPDTSGFGGGDSMGAVLGVEE